LGIEQEIGSSKPQNNSMIDPSFLLVRFLGLFFDLEDRGSKFL
jgi:hypothetical protein